MVKTVALCRLNFILSFCKKSKIQETKAGNNFVLLPQLRNMIDKLIKFYLQRPLKVLQFPKIFINIFIISKKFLIIRHVQVGLCI